MWTVAGLSDAGGDAEPAAQSSAAFVERHDVRTPLMTPPKSTTPSPRTPSPSVLNEPPVVPAIHAAAAKHPPTLPPPASREPVVRMVDAATECGL